MATQRQSIIRGPGTVTFGGVKFFDASGITAEIDSATQQVPSSIAGNLDTIKTDQTGKVSLTPVGNLSEALIDVLFPAWLRSPEIGRSVFGNTDSPLVIASKAGQKVTFHCAALTNPPDLQLSPVKTAFGQTEFTALLANGKLPTVARHARARIETMAEKDKELVWDWAREKPRGTDLIGGVRVVE